MRRTEILLRLVRIPLDFMAVVVAFSLAYFLRAHPEEYLSFLSVPSGELLDWVVYFPFVIQAAFLLVFYFALVKLYSLRKSYRFYREMGWVMLMLLVWLMTIIFYFFLVRVSFFSRLVLGLGFVFSVVFIACIRLVLRSVQRKFWRNKIGRRRLIIIGSSDILDQLVPEWSSDVSIDILGSVHIHQRSLSLLGLQSLGEISSFESLLTVYRADEVVQVESSRFDHQLVEFCQLHSIEYRFVPDLLDVQRTNFDIDFVSGVPIIMLRAARLDEWGRVVKRAFDFVVSGFLIVLFSPIWVVFALLIKLDSSGHVFYRSDRISRHCRFGMFKFRSMVFGADRLKPELAHLNKRSGPLFKIPDDPRVTRLGRFMRRWSIDELPQLFNVFLGDISLVGPRAHLPEEVALYEKKHRKVLIIKAGVTGLPQISGRSHLDFEKEVKLDVYYIENWSIWLDLWILWGTVWVVMEGKGE